MRILVLTNIYPGPGMEEENTPVVHYFAREWVGMGHEVRVIHYPPNFPRLLMWTASLVKKQLASLLGIPLRTTVVKEREYEIDGVRIKRVPMKKYYLHAAYGKRQMNVAYQKSLRWLEEEQFVPDVVTAHWVNPQVEMLLRFKQQYHCRACYVAHIPPFEFERIYSREQVERMLSQIDVMGFRSLQIKREFEGQYALPDKTFMCYSGIPEDYLLDSTTERTFDTVSSFIFVGTLYRRKHPIALMEGLKRSFGTEPFSLTFVGQGNMENDIRKYARRYLLKEQVTLLGRLPRPDVVRELRKSDVFVMISEKETFGLVYLEAMACGCITVASRHEGFDGIIRDGENGFLCDAGDVDELARVISKIRELPPEDLQRISQAAIATAHGLTDKRVALTYAEALK